MKQQVLQKANKMCKQHLLLKLLISWKELLLGDCTYTLCAYCRRPELLLDFFTNLLHCRLGLLDGSLGGVKSAEAEEHHPDDRSGPRSGQ